MQNTLVSLRLYIAVENLPLMRQCFQGLFAPRVGQQYRDEQRRRRSQFDRGTTAAEREVVYVRTLAPRAPSPVKNGLKSAPCTYPAMKVWYSSAVAERGPRTS